MQPMLQIWMTPYMIYKFWKLHRLFLLKLLWVGRFIDWKHPFLPLKIAHALSSKEIKFSLKMIGNGPLEAKLKEYTNNVGIKDFVDFTGSLPHIQIHEVMRNSDVYLFTSDQKEGWGVVLNEAMINGNIILSTKKPGASTYLLNSDNAVLLKSFSVKEWVQSIEAIYENIKQYDIIVKNAVATIKDEWNADISTERIIKFIKAILEKKDPPIYKSGPMSQS